MSRKFNVYDKVTGLFTGKVLMSNNSDRAHEFARGNLPEEHDLIEGDYDHQIQRIDVDTGLVVSQEPAPPTVAQNRAVATAQIRDLESRAIRALIEQALGHEGARERLEALHKQITDLRPAITATQA